MSKTSNIVQQILEGASPREVISAAASEEQVGAVTPTDEVATVTKKVVRNGNVVKKTFKKYKKRRILTAAQKRAIRKAQAASKKSTAKTKRIKSLRKAATFEGEGEETLTLDILCPDCGTNGLEVLDGDYESTIFVCPDCGKRFALVDVEALQDLMPELPEGEDDDDSDVDIDIAEDDDVVDVEDESASIPATESEGVCGKDTVCGGNSDDVCGKDKVCGSDDEEQLYFEPED